MYTGYYSHTWNSSINRANSETYRYNNGLMSYAERKAYEDKMRENRERAWFGRSDNR